MDWNFFQYALALPTSFKIKNGKNKSILRDSFNDILSPSINDDNVKQGLPSIKNLYNEEYVEYTNKIYSENSFLNSNLWDGKKINKDFQFFKKTKDNESIKSLDIFFRLYLMNKGFNVLKEDSKAESLKSAPIINSGKSFKYFPLKVEFLTTL